MAENAIRWDDDHEMEIYELYFTPFYDEEYIATLKKDEDDWWQINSDTISEDIFTANTLEQAKKEVLERTANHFTEMRDFYDHYVTKLEEMMRANDETE